MSNITLTWDADGSIESFSIYRAEQSMDSSNLPTPIATGIKDKIYVDSDVIEDKTYFYRVASIKGGQQKLSDEISVTSSTASQYTTSLLHFDQDFTDQKGVTWVNNGVTIDKTIKKFGDASAYFNGSSFLTAQNTAIAQIETGDFTIEFWCYPTRVNLSQDMTIWGYGTSSGQGVNLFLSKSNATPGWWDGYNSDYFTTGQSLVLNTWHHIAYCRKNGVLMCFINGIKYTLSSAHTRSLSPTSNIKVGGNYDGTGEKGFYGYLDEFRILVDLCAYTENFTPPSTAF